MCVYGALHPSTEIHRKSGTKRKTSQGISKQIYDRDGTCGQVRAQDGSRHSCEKKGESKVEGR